VLEAYSTKVKPTRTVDPKAAKVNGYTETDWVDAPRFPDALSSLTAKMLCGKYVDKYIVVAHFAEFDKSILGNQCEAHGIEMPFKRAWVDTAQVAWPLAFNDILSSRSLDTLCKYYGIINDAPHTAAGDAAATMHAYWAMMRRLSTVVMAEEYITEIGGTKLGAIRKMVGL
jgi:DNA polymerase-3 subunit alpha (Gram-positive type)